MSSSLIEYSDTVVGVLGLSRAIQIGATALLAIVAFGLLAYRLTHRYADDPEDSPHLTGQDDDASASVRGNGRGEDSVTPAPSHGGAPVMTDEHRVLQMLESNGGQLRQSTIVDNTEWSKSKISRLLSKMEDQSQIEKISHGRENIIVLADIDEVEMR